MNLTGPKSLASALYWFVTAAFVVVLLIMSALLISAIFAPAYLESLTVNIQSGPLHVAFPYQSGQARWLILSLSVVSLALAAVILFLLSNVLKLARSGDAFDSKTPNRLRAMAWTVIIGSFVRTLLCAALLPHGARPGSGVEVYASLDTDSLFLGLVLLVLVEVFRRGHELKAESDLTV